MTFPNNGDLSANISFRNWPWIHLLGKHLKQWYFQYLLWGLSQIRGEAARICKYLHWHKRRDFFFVISRGTDCKFNLYFRIHIGLKKFLIFESCVEGRCSCWVNRNNTFHDISFLCRIEENDQNAISDVLLFVFRRHKHFYHSLLDSNIKTGLYFTGHSSRKILFETWNAWLCVCKSRIEYILKLYETFQVVNM